MTNSALQSDPLPGLMLHMGLPMTGTTTLQSLLFSRHSGIDYLGRKRGFPGAMNCRSQEIYELLRPMLWNMNEPFEPAKLRPQWRGLLGENAESKVLVGSWEGLGASTLSHHAEVLRRTVEVFGKCRLLICLRNPITLLPSLYLQMLRARHKQGSRKLLGNRWYLDIDHWMASWQKVGGLDHPLSYAERIRISAEKLGRENVQVLLFEDLCQDQDRFIRSVCKFLGVDEEEGLTLVERGHLHGRLSEGQIEFLKRVQRSLVWRWWLNRKSPAEQRRMLDDHGRDGRPAKVVLPPQWIQVVADVTREGNQWLQEHYQLDLERHQYPL